VIGTPHWRPGPHRCATVGVATSERTATSVRPGPPESTISGFPTIIVHDDARVRMRLIERCPAIEAGRARGAGTLHGSHMHAPGLARVPSSASRSAAGQGTLAASVVADRARAIAVRSSRILTMTSMSP
jgi:hypothetical protein